MNRYRPQHEVIVRRIATALRELSDAVQAERALHDLIGRNRAANTLPPLGFPGIGDHRNPSSPSGRWLAAARRHGYAIDSDPHQEQTR